MKPTHKLLFILCPMLVLGFIYYSSGKLHLPVWGQKSHEDAEEPTVAQAKSAEVKGIPDNSVEEPTVAQAKSAEVQGIPENDAEEPTVAQAKGAEVKRIPELEMDNSVGPIVGSENILLLATEELNMCSVIILPMKNNTTLPSVVSVW